MRLGCRACCLLIHFAPKVLGIDLFRGKLQVLTLVCAGNTLEHVIIQQTLFSHPRTLLKESKKNKNPPAPKKGSKPPRKGKGTPSGKKKRSKPAKRASEAAEEKESAPKPAPKKKAKRSGE